VLCVALTIAAVVAVGRSLPEARARRLGRGLGVALPVFYGVDNFVRVRWLGFPLSQVWPLELCSALFFIDAVAFWSDREAVWDVAVLWTFAGTLQSMITPTPSAGFPSVEFVRYFLCHGLLILAALYGVFAMGRGVSRRGFVRAVIALQAFEIGVGVIDWAFRQNFLYLRYPPPSPTLFDALGPWPRYLVGLEVVAIALLLLWWGILRWAQRVFARRAPVEEVA
jgi:hypothetical integral membrane protein (TIGR02206 family)